MVSKIVIHRRCSLHRVAPDGGGLINDQRTLAAFAGDAHVERGGNRHQPIVHVMFAATVPHFTSPTFRRPATSPTRSIRSQLLRPPVLLPPPAPRRSCAKRYGGLFQVDVVFRPDDAPCPGTMRTRWWNCF